LLEWSIDGGDDASLFYLDTSSGNLFFNSPADFENPQDSDTNNLYHLIVSVTDSLHTDTKTITIQLLNQNDNQPQILHFFSPLA